MIKISVIIPSYCPDDYIFECLDSVCQQSFDIHEYEILVIVNGCNEPYVTKINDYILSKGYKNYIRVLQTDKAGVSNARNMGIDYSKGEYLVFVDDDDIISHNYLEELLSVSSRFCVGCSNSYSFTKSIDIKIDNFLTSAFESCQGTSFNHFRWRKFLSPPVGKLIHRDIIGVDRFPVTISRSEDSVFCLRISRKIKDMSLASESCIYYIRERVGSVTRRKRTTFQEIRALFNIELTYISVWLKHPFSYDIRFVFSRIAAGFKNFIHYCKGNKKS